MRPKARSPVWRAVVLMAVTGLLLASAATATAKGSGKPEPSKAYAVTMAGDLATTCPGFEPSVTMTLFGNVLEGRGQNLETNLAVAWTRELDAGYGTMGSGLVGCHGNGPPNANAVYGMWITLDLKKQRVTVQWRFDAVWDDQGNVEFFELASNPQGPTQQAGYVSFENGIASGPFVLRRFRGGQGWQETYPLDLNFHLTLVPLAPG